MRRPRPGRTQLTHFPASRPAATGITVNATRPSCAAGAGRPSQAAGLAAAILAKTYPTNQVISPGGGIYPQTGTGRHSPRRTDVQAGLPLTSALP